jgi:hypothetical protein
MVGANAGCDSELELLSLCKALGSKVAWMESARGKEILVSFEAPK